jgi:hypothetical protein
MKTPTLFAAMGLAMMFLGLILHRGADVLAGPSERTGLGIELLGLGLVGFARVLQEAKNVR